MAVPKAERLVIDLAVPPHLASQITGLWEWFKEYAEENLPNEELAPGEDGLPADSAPELDEVKKVEQVEVFGVTDIGQGHLSVKCKVQHHREPQRCGRDGGHGKADLGDVLARGAGHQVGHRTQSWVGWRLAAGRVAQNKSLSLVVRRQEGGRREACQIQRDCPCVGGDRVLAWLSSNGRLSTSGFCWV